MKSLITFLALFITLSPFFCQEETIQKPPSELEEIIDFPDEEAIFPGGPVAMSRFKIENFRYPADIIDVQGKVYLEFCVEKNGSVTQIDIMRSVNASIDKAAMDVIRKMPKWIPAVHNGKAVRTIIRIPIIVHYH